MSTHLLTNLAVIACTGLVVQALLALFDRRSRGRDEAGVEESPETRAERWMRDLRA
jgi:hypothetical protein